MFFKLRLNLALKTALLWVVVDHFGFVVDGCGSFWVVPRFSNYARLTCHARTGKAISSLRCSKLNHYKRNYLTLLLFFF